MRAALVLCVLCGTAAAAPWGVEVPPGWTEHRDLADSHISALKSVPQMKHVEVTIFLSPQNDAQLTLMNLDVELNDASRTQLEGFDRGMATGAGNTASHHVSDSRHVSGKRMTATSIDELNGLRIHYERVYGVDSHDVIHVVSAICTAPPASIGACEDIQKTLHLDLADSQEIKDESLAYKLGYGLGGIAAMAGLIWLVRRRR
jgi:hypothetical protein